MLYGRDVHGSFVCSLRCDGRIIAISCSLSSSLPPPPHPRSRRAGRCYWSAGVLVEVVQFVHAVAAKVLVERRPHSSRQGLADGLGRSNRCVFLAHVQQLVCSLVHLFLTNTCHLGQLPLNTARVHVAKQAFGRQHLRHNMHARYSWLQID